ncbi:hypothetical protein DK419_12955 [Methylobacterium terrae]|uniref:SGNH hydrolase-type esterase domain-containing protein n=1 Tax=Methylobacterium terrae TaxID=2202827 RepID=A0A2U8WLV1_9HYPH|nr:hypothetical protein DK419_12955 [Methylobacterium terrae]
MRNPNSQTHALEIFSSHLMPARPDAIPVLQLGEVDCGFVIWWRADKLGEGVEAQLYASINAHLGYVDQLIASGYSQVVLTGAVPPTIQDGQDWGEIANMRREVTTSIAERTELTHRYNALLKNGAQNRNCPFVDITPALLDPATGVLADHYRSDDPNDHHLHSARAGKLWAEALNRIEASAAT